MGQKKILYIEDEPEQVLMVQTRLEAAGYQVVFALAGEEGLKKVRLEKPDIILLDIIMPGINGYEVCQSLKQDPATRDIPIIIITASGALELEKKCRLAGANEIITKPFESSDLLAKIKVYLPE